MRALVVVNGELPSQLFLEQIAKQFDFVAATDGAAAHLPRAIKIDLICGDFDSISVAEAQHNFPEAKIELAGDQNSSDLEKTVEQLKIRGADSITFVGALGGRIDHSLVALSLLMGLQAEFRVSLIDEESELIVCSPQCARGGEVTFVASVDQTVSLIALSANTIVSISGVHWPLANCKLELGSGGVSNRALGGDVKVLVSAGCVGLTRPLAIDPRQQMRK